jgi:hypothetical protein
MFLSDGDNLIDHAGSRRTNWNRRIFARFVAISVWGLLRNCRGFPRLLLVQGPRADSGFRLSGAARGHQLPPQLRGTRTPLSTEHSCDANGHSARPRRRFGDHSREHGRRPISCAAKGTGNASRAAATGRGAQCRVGKHSGALRPRTTSRCRWVWNAGRTWRLSTRRLRR